MHLQNTSQENPEHDGTPLISVVILNYNGRHLIEECLDSVFRQTYRHHEVIVVDNASRDGSVEFLKSTCGPRIRLIENCDNLGFAEGNNIGIAAAAGEYIALLNNDAVAAADWLDALVTAAVTSGSDYGMWGSKILFYDNRDVIDTAGHLIYPDGLNRGRGKNEADRGQYDRQEEILFPSGCAALYRKKMIDEIGAFDPDFFAYGDDTDIGLRARLAGWKCLYVPSSKVFHRSSATAGVYSPFKAYLVERNRIWILVKYFPVARIMLSPWYTMVRFLFQAFGALTGKGAAGRFVKNSSAGELIRVLFRAYGDAFRKLPVMLRKREEFRSHTKVSRGEFSSWLRKYAISAREISLKD